MPNFGDPRPEHANNFLWPTPGDLEQLNLSKPLRLKAIKTKGVPNVYLTAIQLVFEDGIESPMFDTRRGAAGDEIRTEVLNN